MVTLQDLICALERWNSTHHELLQLSIEASMLQITFLPCQALPWRVSGEGCLRAKEAKIDQRTFLIAQTGAKAK